MSLISSTISSPDRVTWIASARWSSSSVVSSSSFVRPSTPFIGVRISWLMLARNADFVFDASTAASRAAASSADARLRSVTSRLEASRQERPSIITSQLTMSTSTTVPSL